MQAERLDFVEALRRKKNTLGAAAAVSQDLQLPFESTALGVGGVFWSEMTRRLM